MDTSLRHWNLYYTVSPVSFFHLLYSKSVFSTNFPLFLLLSRLPPSLSSISLSSNLLLLPPLLSLLSVGGLIQQRGALTEGRKVNGACGTSMRGEGRGVRSEAPPFRRDPIGQPAVQGGEADRWTGRQTRSLPLTRD